MTAHVHEVNFTGSQSDLVRSPKIALHRPQTGLTDGIGRSDGFRSLGRHVIKRKTRKTRKTRKHYEDNEEYAPRMGTHSVFRVSEHIAPFCRRFAFEIGPG